MPDQVAPSPAQTAAVLMSGAARQRLQASQQAEAAISPQNGVAATPMRVPPLPQAIMVLNRLAAPVFPLILRSTAR